MKQYASEIETRIIEAIASQNDANFGFCRSEKACIVMLGDDYFRLVLTPATEQDIADAEYTNEETF